MRIVQRVLCRREKVAQMMENLESLHARGEIEADHYERLQAEYGTLRTAADDNVEAVREYLRQKEQSLREQRRQVQESVEQLGVREKVGEVTGAQAERLRRKLEGDVAQMDRKIMRVETALNARSSADIGGFVDVDVHARVEPGSGVFGDELDAPEILGAAQESMRAWHGRAHELAASARVRGREWFGSDEVKSARTTLWGTGARALTWVDAAADRCTQTINGQLEKRGWPGISSTLLKTIVAAVLLVGALFLLLRDSYPGTPARVLETVWETANAGDAEDVEQYLSRTTLGWIDEALAMMPGKTIQTLLRENWDKRTRGQTMERIEVIEEVTKDARATVKYVVHYSDGHASAPRVETFVLEEGRWKLELRMSDLF